MKEKNKKRIAFLDQQYQKLEKACTRLYEIHSYQEYGDSEYHNYWKQARELCSKIESNEWESLQDVLNIYKAKANSYLGLAYTEKGDYDEALKYLKLAREKIEKQSAQYLEPAVYVRTLTNLGKCYMEKHSPAELIEECHNSADQVLKDVRDYFHKEEPYWYIKAALELKLQQAIAKMDVYGQPCGSWEEEAWNFLEDAKAYYGKLPVYADVLKKAADRQKYAQWKRRQEATLETSKGEYFKKLYFSTKDIVRFLNDHNDATDDWREKRRYLNEVQKRLQEELKYELSQEQMNKASGERERLEWLLEKVEGVKPLLSQYIGSLKQATEELREYCLEVAFRTFAYVIGKIRNNTISMGNIAILLYDYYGETGKRNFLSDLLEQYWSDFRDISISKNNTVIENIKVILNKILEIDPINMFALNIKAALSKDLSISGEIDHYPTLRQSSLKRRFGLIEDELEGKCKNEWQRIEINLIILHNKIVEFMNSAIIDFSSPEWKKLEVAHYTRLEVIPKLLNKGGHCRLKIQNVHHLNDPLEGALFVDQLKKKIGGEDKPLIQELLRLYNSEKNGAVRNSVYMGSFTGKVDQLNMWTRYGDNGKGCCLQIEAEKFFDSCSKISFSEASTNDGPGYYKMDDIKYPLYMVMYLPEDPCIDLKEREEYARSRAEMARHDVCWWEKQADLIHAFIGLKEKVVLLLNKIEDDFCAIDRDISGLSKETREKIKRELCNIIMAILDLARFLIKSEYYQDEREYRIIQYASDPKYDDSVKGIPKLYIEVEKDMVYQKIFFGPLVQNFDSQAAYILNIKKDAEDGNPKTNWEVEVCKSGISYR
ncbi:MAG: tetratricopeptide repeat protein [Eubacteriales bacterium]|nr:tetratricopeptide repeat protein [Eubacteriales bacterium]